MFSNFYSFAECKLGTVKDHMIRTTTFCLWNIQLRRNLNDSEVDDMGSLLEILDGYSLGDRAAADERLWVLDEDKGFFVKSYNALTPSDSHSFPVCFIWNKLIPTKISFLLWELWWDHASTLDNLTCRGFISLNWCCMCGSSAKSLGHLFLHCPGAASLWSHMIARYKVMWAQPESLKLLFSCWPGQSFMNLSCWLVGNGDVEVDPSCDLLDSMVRMQPVHL